MLAETARNFAAERLWPVAARCDKEQEFPIEVLREAAALGFAAMYCKDDALALGGAGLSRHDAAVVFENLAMADASTTAYLSIHNMCTWIVDTYGTTEQRQRFIPKLATMEHFASYCLTEPSAGSDAGSLKTRAEFNKTTGKYVLNGSKAFISGGGSSDVYFVMARTDPDPAKKAKGITCFVVEKGMPGLSFGEKEQKLGWNSQPTRAVYFDNVEVPAENMIGELNKGFSIAMKALDGGRVNIAACSIGGAQMCLDVTADYVKQRVQFDQPLAQFQAVQFKLADLATKLYSSRPMVRDAATALDLDRADKTQVCAMAKLKACDECFEVADECLQLHGGYGYLKDYPIERQLRDLRVHRILEGTDAVMRLIASRAVLH